MTTGWPLPTLAQDDDPGLFRWFASKLDARALVRESALRIEGEHIMSRVIPILDDDGRIELWYVRGIEGQVFPTKIEAEAAARRQFIGEHPDTRYGRIYYRAYYPESFFEERKS